MLLFKITRKSPIPKISEDLLFFLFPTSRRSHVNWNVMRKFVQGNFMANNYDCFRFSSKNYVQLPSNIESVAVIFLSTDKMTPLSHFTRISLFTRKCTNKNVAFLNVLSVIRNMHNIIRYCYHIIRSCHNIKNQLQYIKKKAHAIIKFAHYTMLRIHNIMHTIQHIIAYEQEIMNCLQHISNWTHPTILYNQTALAFHTYSFNFAFFVNIGYI